MAEPIAPITDEDVATLLRDHETFMAHDMKVSTHEEDIKQIELIGVLVRSVPVLSARVEADRTALAKSEAEVARLTEALEWISDGKTDDLAADPMVWSNNVAFIALGGVIEDGERKALKGGTDND